MEAIIKFRCQKEEKQLLENLAKDLKISPSNYLRAVINNREKPVIKIAKEEKENRIENSLNNTYHSLGKIGVNLNQIAHYFNLEHLKSFDILEPKIEELLLTNKLNQNDSEFIRLNLQNLAKEISDLRIKIEELINDSNSNKI